MLALDTNIIVRFLLQNDDDKQQNELVRSRFKQAEKGREQFFTPHVVMMEVVWVLSRTYRIEREKTINAIELLLQMSLFVFESPPILDKWLREARNSSFDLPDILIGQTALYHGASTVLTFDKKAARSPHFRLLNQTGDMINGTHHE